MASKDESSRSVSTAVGLTLAATVGLVITAQLGYVTEPRDRASAWLADELEPGEEVEVYENSVADLPAVHGHPFTHYPYGENASGDASLVTNETAFTAWMLAMPERAPDYIVLTERAHRYVDPDSKAYSAFPDRRRYVRGLLDGQYAYEIAAEFGRGAEQGTGWRALLRVGLNPGADGMATKVTILERTRPGE